MTKDDERRRRRIDPGPGGDSHEAERIKSVDIRNDEAKVLHDVDFKASEGEDELRNRLEKRFLLEGLRMRLQDEGGSRIGSVGRSRLRQLEEAFEDAFAIRPATSYKFSHGTGCVKSRGHSVYT